MLVVDRRSPSDDTPGAVGISPYARVLRLHPAWPASLIMLLLGLWHVGRAGLWGDELATWGMTQVSWREMWALAGERDAVLLPYYAAMHCWAQIFGSSDVSLRLPSVLAMTAAAGLVAAVGARLGGLRVGLLAGLLFAGLPTSSRYAQEARPYALATLAAVLATLLLLRALDAETTGRFALYAGAVALLGAAHAVALALVLAHGAAVVALRRDLIRRWLCHVTLGGLPGLTLLAVGSQQARQIAWIKRARPEMLFDHPGELFGVSLLAGAVVTLAMVSLSLRTRAAVCTCWALVSTGTIFAAGMLTDLWTPRYLLFVIPAWVLLAALTLGGLSVRRSIAIVVLLCLMAAPTQLQLRRTDGHGQGTHEAAAVITDQVRPGDAIAYPSRTSPWLGRDVVAHYVARQSQPTDLLELRPPRTGGHLVAGECVDVAGCLAGNHRLWIILVGDLADPLRGLSETKYRPLLEYTVAKIWHVRGLTIALLTR